jgi:predicted HAD superfamily phosphohydrolase YqeG
VASFAHIPAGLFLAFRFREKLAHVLKKTAAKTSILTLDPSALRESGIVALALDFDGVLAPHGSPAPLPEAREWLERCSATFGADRIFILSNKPTETRKSWFSKHFPGMRFVSGVRKKPFPDGIDIIGKLARVPPPAILMVDDRLLTGCLAAINAGAVPYYVRHPYVSLKHRPFIELFFVLLRSGERLFVRLLTLF